MGVVSVLLVNRSALGNVPLALKSAAVLSVTGVTKDGSCDVAKSTRGRARRGPL